MMIMSKNQISRNQILILKNKRIMKLLVLKVKKSFFTKKKKKKKKSSLKVRSL